MAAAIMRADTPHMPGHTLSDLLKTFAQQSTENALLLLDPDRRITWCNPACCRLFGYSEAEMNGQPVQMLFTREDVDQGVADYEFDVAADSADMNNDRWMQRADGSRFWATGNTTGLLDADGMLIGYGKMLRDSTDLKEQLESLRNRVGVLADSNHRKELFLAKLSHELRNPLGALANAVALIRMRDQLEPEIEQSVQIIARQSDSLRGLINDLLDVARISTGNLQLELRTVDMREPIARAVEKVRPSIDSRRQVLTQYILDHPMLITGDGQKLEQVFTNLLSNASKYTPQLGNIELRASMNGSEVWVHVIDDGIGIATDLLPRVFDLFTRSAEVAGSTDGLGIGLAIVKQFVELHGGSVQVRSSGTGSGSEFTVRLPAAAARLAPGVEDPAA